MALAYELADMTATELAGRIRQPELSPVAPGLSFPTDRRDLR
jgi:hypothetical protein